MPRVVAERADILPALAEVFREYGYAGATLSLLGEATGLGKGSLYHFFPGGKEEMASAVLAEIDGWFEQHVFAPLRESDDPKGAIGAMCDEVVRYFRSGRRVCLVGALALSDARDVFADAIKEYFVRWVKALTAALVQAGRSRAVATGLAEEVVGGIQGAIVLARALNQPEVFERAVKNLRQKLQADR